MATEPVLTLLDTIVVRRRVGFILPNVLANYWSLTKTEVNFLIAATGAAGFWTGALVTLQRR